MDQFRTDGNHSGSKQGRHPRFAVISTITTGSTTVKKDPQDEIGADMVQIGDKPPLDPINEVYVRI